MGLNALPVRPDWPTAWGSARERLRRELGDAVFDAWIGPLTLESWENDELRLGTAKSFVRNWVASHYTPRIERALRSEGAIAAAITVEVCVAPPMAVGGGLARPAQPAPLPMLRPDDRDDEGATPKSLRTRLLDNQQTFDTFVPGACNEFALRAAQAFAKGMGDSPLLYLHGSFGYGKTHLLNAAAIEFRKRGARPLFLRSEDFMRHFLGALYRKETLAFKEELRSAEVLIIDDLQHICRSAATASEFLYTVNAFSDLRRQIMIAADRAPSALEGLAPEVRSRLSGALVVTLSKPDRDTRLAILEKRLAETMRTKPHVRVPDEVLEHIADAEEGSPRELIGVFTRVATYVDLTKKAVTLDTIEEVGGFRMPAAGKTSIEDIQKKTAEFYKLELKDFHSPHRARRVARPRQVAMYLARKLTTRSLPEIGRRFGGRDHTTVLHACRRVEELCQEDPVFRQEVDFLSHMLSRQG